VLLGGTWDFLFLGEREKIPQRAQRTLRREKQE
jgi:hypothetical protein